MIVLFDIDGTLLLSGGAGRDALSAALDAHLPVAGSMDAITCAGKTDPLIVEEACLQATGALPGDALIDRVLADYAARLPAEIERNLSFRLMPGVPEVIDLLEARPRTALAIATGNIAAGADAKLRRAGLRERIPLGGYGDGVRHRPEILTRAIAAVRAHRGADWPGPAVIVGDTVRDVEAAHELGLPVAAIREITTSAEDLAAAGADLIVEDLREIVGWLDGLERGG